MARVLIVDWEEEERVFFWEVLEEAGHELLFAAGGQTALEVWKSKDPDLVITELYLPELNGLRLIKELKKRDPFCRILALSEISADLLDLAEDYGACSILYKPVEPSALLEAVGEALKTLRQSHHEAWHDVR
jgi:CheY-like chemotaxis protein